MGAVLEQLTGNEWEPLGFFLKKFSPAQTNYSTYDRELTAIYEAIKFFRPWIEGNTKLEIRTGHKPLTYVFAQKSDKASQRQLRQLSLIGQFTTKILYVKGQDNTVADSLSRVNALRLPTTIDFEELATAQCTNEELLALPKDNQSSLKLQRFTFGPNQQAVYCDMSTHNICPFALKQFRQQIFNVHNLNHPGGKSPPKLLINVTFGRR